MGTRARTTVVCVLLSFPKYHLLTAPFARVDEFEGAPAESACPNAVG